jgi:hypothetical protein
MAESERQESGGKKISSMKRGQRSSLNEQEPDDANSNEWRNGDGRRERRRAGD